MRLSELNPRFFGTGAGVDVVTGAPVPVTEKIGVSFDCPCGDASDEAHPHGGQRLCVPFSNPIGPGHLVGQHGWHRTGEDFETMTLEPSIRRLDDCRWHGVVRDGEVVTVP